MVHVELLVNTLDKYQLSEPSLMLAFVIYGHLLLATEINRVIYLSNVAVTAYYITCLHATGNGQTVRLVPGHPGYLEGHLFRLRNRSDEIDGFQVKVVRDELTTVSFSDVTVNVKSGEMIVHVTGSKGLAHVQEAETDFGESEVAQYLCSAFTLAVSHLLCQPHGRPLASPATGPAAALCMDDYVSSYSLIASAGLNCRQVC